MECTCRIPDWRKFRLALGLGVGEMASLLSVDRHTIQRLELSPHHCPHRSTMLVLRLWLRAPELVTKLQAAQYPYPYPEDLAAC
jgi:hypothetical protein